MGTTSAANTATQNFSYNPPTNPHWRNGGGTQNFQIGWNAATNTAYTTVFNAAGLGTTVSLANPGTRLGSSAIWTLPVSTFYTSASIPLDDGSISIGGLALSAGATLVSGSLPATLTALEQNNVPVQTNLSAPLVINAAGSGGSWFLSGTVRFTGLVTIDGTAIGSQLQFLLGASGTQVPEPVGVSMTALGLVGLFVLSRSRLGTKGVQ